MTDSDEHDSGAELWVDRRGKRYAPGETISGGYRLGAWRDEPLVAIELSIVWYTAGQGEEDLFVRHFERRRAPSLPSRSAETPYEFAAELPPSPLSYDGHSVKVCWAVRLRGCFRADRTKLVEVPFWLAAEAAS